MAIRIPTRFNAAGVNHIRMELDHAIDLCDAAKAENSETRMKRLVADASSAYSLILKLLSRVRLSSHEAQEIHQKCVQLNLLLQEFGSLVAA